MNNSTERTVRMRRLDCSFVVRMLQSQVSPVQPELMLISFLVTSGASYEDGTHGIEALDNFVSPGGTFIYKWFATCPFRLYEGDDDCVIFVYHSHHFVDMEMSSGLHGPIIYCKAGTITATIKHFLVPFEHIYIIHKYIKNN